MSTPAPALPDQTAHEWASAYAPTIADKLVERLQKIMGTNRTPGEYTIMLRMRIPQRYTVVARDGYNNFINERFARRAEAALNLGYRRVRVQYNFIEHYRPFCFPPDEIDGVGWALLIVPMICSGLSYLYDRTLGNTDDIYGMRVSFYI